MDRARPGRGDAYSRLACKLRVPTCHEGGHLFMTRLHETAPVVVAIERTHKAVDPVARISKDVSDAPCGEPLQDLIADRFTHPLALFFSPRRGAPRKLTPDSIATFQSADAPGEFRRYDTCTAVTSPWGLEPTSHS